MIAFSRGEALWLLLPWGLFGLWFAVLQLRALGWVESRVASRFRDRFTVHGRWTLRLHLALVGLLGALLIVAAAGPTLPGGVAPSSVGRVLLVVDGSASMFADDVQVDPAQPETLGRRIELARRIALELIDELDGFRFALASFSGTAAIHLPMIEDRQLLDEAMASLEVHSLYRNSGSSFGSALDAASHFLAPETADLQLVLLSDGEMPVPESIDEPLAALARQGVPIHTVAIGSDRGQGRVIYDFRDVVTQVAEPRVLRRFVTHRVDEHLRRMADLTGGRFEVGGPGTAVRMAAAVRRAAAEPRPGARDDRLRRPIGWLPLALFLGLFALERLVIGRGRRSGPPPFELDRITSPVGAAAGARRAALMLVLALAGGSCGEEDPVELAHRENERGIAWDQFGRHDRARPFYQRAAGLGVEPQIPTYNLARSVTLAGGFSEAHEIYQQALELDPDLVEALHNDGVTLYRWGAAERDPRDCDLERTRDLWEQARRRFATARRKAEPGGELFRWAGENLMALGSQLAEIDRLRENPLPECLGAGEGGQGGDGEDGGEGGSSPPPEGGVAGGAAGSPPPAPPALPELSAPEFESIAEALDRIAAQRREEGKYHRRTALEQFPREDWMNPQALILW